MNFLLSLVFLLIPQIFTCCIFMVIQIKTFSNFPSDFFLDPWVIYKCVVYFPNIWDFSRYIFAIDLSFMLWSENVFFDFSPFEFIET